ncbi:hypothetical protein PR001_g4632 [Phytophthora rubi]|uniref:Uncharacterized protein n=1 Tax=Phytophthora rubi TaxID=129364 RepID=A0A6A3NNX7_9STRA|nr:hypothetical protein PR002_g7296 [Phytophthora rubi]KAE9046275.1 hypothetical protein PR001_g4632 [Phytophthora rubi]
METTVRLFIRQRSETRARTVANDVLGHLAQKWFLMVNLESGDDVTAALGTVQRYIKRCGYKWGKKPGSAFAMSTENVVKRNNYVAMMASEEADQHCNIYLDESYIHHNYYCGLLCDQTNPSVVKAKHK